MLESDFDKENVDERWKERPRRWVCGSRRSLCSVWSERSDPPPPSPPGSPKYERESCRGGKVATVLR